MTADDDLPVLEGFVPGGGDDRVDVPADRRDATVGGVLLAAGTSSRFGDENKLLATLDGEPIVRRAAGTLVAAGLSPRIAVVGHEGERIADALDGLGYEVVHNEAYASGQATSVVAAVAALRGEVDAAVFALGDMPFVRPETVGALVRAYRAGAGTALAAAAEGVRGNPVLFDASHFDALAAVSDGRGGRAVLLGSDSAALVETGDPGVHRDVDTPGDLDAYRS